MKRDVKNLRLKYGKAKSISKQQLENQARKAGKKLFGTSLVLPKVLQVRSVNLSDLSDEFFDDYEYLFYPSSGRGSDKAGESWKEWDNTWQDVDGKIYTACGDGEILVVSVDLEPSQEKPIEEKPENTSGVAFVRSGASVSLRKNGQIVGQQVVPAGGLLVKILGFGIGSEKQKVAYGVGWDGAAKIPGPTFVININDLER